LKPEAGDDPRSIPTKMNLAKNKLRAMGLNMGYEPDKGLVDAYQKVYNQVDEKNKYDDSFIEGETGSKRARRDTTAAMNRSGMGYAKVGRQQKERQERHKADRGKKTKGTKAGHSGSAYPQKSHTIDTMYPHKKTARLKAKAAAMKKEDYGYAEIYPDKKVEQIDEISADLALKASKKAEVERGKAAVAGNKERAIEKMKQSSRLYAKQAKKRRMEAK